MVNSSFLKTLSTSVLLTFASFIAINSYSNHQINSQSLNLSPIKILIANLEQIKIETKNETESDVAVSKEQLVINSISKELEHEIRRNKKPSSRAIVYLPPQKKIEIKKDILKEKLVVRKTKLEKSIEEDLSVFEINNNEFVFLRKFGFEKVSTLNIVIPDVEKLDISDEVKVAISATKKQNTETTDVKAKTQQVDEEDIVLYDYSSKKESEVTSKNISPQKIDRDLYERPISNKVKEVIQREMGSVKKLDIEQVASNRTSTINGKSEDQKLFDKIEEEIPTEDKVGFEYSSVDRKVEIKKDPEVSAFTSEPKLNIEITLKAINVDMSTHKKAQAFSFEFIPDYDRNDRNYDNGSGEIKLGHTSNSANSLMSGLIAQRGMIPSRVDLLMNTHNQIIPIFEEELYIKYINSKGIEDTTSVLISTSGEILDADLDTGYSHKIFLDKNFKESETSKQFILFLGVKSGNSLLRYRIGNNNSEKVIFIGEGEIFFEEPTFTEAGRETFELITRNLMSSKSKELNISQSDVKFFNTNNFSKKTALNLYQLKIPSLVLGSRKYLEIKTQGNSVFLGSENKETIEVPSKEFVSKVLEFNQVSGLNDRCLIQLNIQKELSEIKVSGKNSSGEMMIETSYLDQDGNMDKENSEISDKIFLLGERDGTVSARLNYADGTTDVLKSMCADGTYLIEQL